MRHQKKQEEEEEKCGSFAVILHALIYNIVFMANK